jgi:signal transduction histidine kinase
VITVSRRLTLGAVALFLLIFSLASLLVSFPEIGRPFAGFKVYPGMAVAWQIPQDWAGLRAGLRPMDRILRVDDRAVDTSEALARHVAALPAGTPHSYEVERSVLGGEPSRFTLVIPAQTFTWGDWAVSFFGRWFAGLCYLLIGFWVIALKPRDRTAQVHAGLCFSLGMLQMGSYDATTTHLLFNSWTFLPALIAMGAFGALLALLLPAPLEPAKGRKLELAAIGVSLALAVFCLAFQHHPDTFYLTRILASTWSVLGAWGLILSIAWRGFRPSSPPRQRNSAKIMMLGGLASTLPSPLSMVASALGYPIPLTVLQDLTLVFFPLCIGYAIVRHQLFDVDVVLRRSLVYSLVGILLFGLYLILLGGARALMGTHDVVANILATAVIALCFAPLRDRTKAWLDAKFFRAPYDFQAVVSAFASVAQEMTGSEALTHAYVEQLKTVFLPRYAALFLLSPDGALQLSATDNLCPTSRQLAEQKAAACLAQGDSETLSGTPSGELGLLLAAGDLPLGVMLLGPKRSDLAYSQQDQQLFLLLSRQYAISLKLITRIEEARRQRSHIEALEESKAMQEQFLNLVSHELRMPLSNILGSLSFLEHFGGAVEPRQRNHLDRIQRNAMTLQGLVSDLLNAAQLRTGQFTIRSEEVRLEQVASEVLQDLHPLAEKKQQLLEIELESDLPAVLGDRLRLAQLLRNLVHNAIRYTPPQGRITVRLACQAGRLRCEVQDTGPGLPVEGRAHLFEQFGRLEGSLDGGIGLGLFIAKGLAEAHGATIGVDSELGHGACFYVLFPLSAKPPEDENERGFSAVESG